MTNVRIDRGDHWLSPGQCMAILDYCEFKGQEKRTATGQIYIERHVENMRNGRFRDYSQIHFCRLGDRFILVNGYHRLNAVIRFGAPVLFNIAIIDVKSEGELRDIYANFDGWGENRPRPVPQLVDAMNLTERFGVKKIVVNAAYKAMPIIKNGLRPVTRGDFDTIKFAGLLWERTAELCNFENEIVGYDICLKDCERALKRALLSTNVMSIALVTLKYRERAAMDFWGSVAANTNLVRGMPQHTLVRSLLNRTFKKQDECIKATALAWNHFYDETSVLQLNARNFIFSLRGTPYE